MKELGTPISEQGNTVGKLTIFVAVLRIIFICSDIFSDFYLAVGDRMDYEFYKTYSTHFDQWLNNTQWNIAKLNTTRANRKQIEFVAAIKERNNLSSSCMEQYMCIPDKESHCLAFDSTSAEKCTSTIRNIFGEDPPRSMLGKENSLLMFQARIISVAAGALVQTLVAIYLACRNEDFQQLLPLKVRLVVILASGVLLGPVSLHVYIIFQSARKQCDKVTIQKLENLVQKLLFGEAVFESTPQLILNAFSLSYKCAFMDNLGVYLSYYFNVYSSTGTLMYISITTSTITITFSWLNFYKDYVLVRKLKHHSWAYMFSAFLATFFLLMGYCIGKFAMGVVYGGYEAEDYLFSAPSLLHLFGIAISILFMLFVCGLLRLINRPSTSNCCNSVSISVSVVRFLTRFARFLLVFLFSIYFFGINFIQIREYLTNPMIIVVRPARIAGLFTVQLLSLFFFVLTVFPHTGARLFNPVVKLVFQILHLLSSCLDACHKCLAEKINEWENLQPNAEEGDSAEKGMDIVLDQETALHHGNKESVTLGRSGEDGDTGTVQQLEDQNEEDPLVNKNEDTEARTKEV